MTDANKTILKRIGITAGILTGIYVLISLFRGWNPMKWFEPATPKDGDVCTTAANTAGHITGGICVEDMVLVEGAVCTTADNKAGTVMAGICVANRTNGNGDLPDDNPLLRVAPDNSTQKAGCVSPTINQGKYYCPPGKSSVRINVGGTWQVLCCP